MTHRITRTRRTPVTCRTRRAHLQEAFLRYFHLYVINRACPGYMEYGDLKTRSFFPVYRTHEKGGLRAASAVGSPPFLSIRHKRLGCRDAHTHLSCIWDPSAQIPDCMHAGW